MLRLHLNVIDIEVTEYALKTTNHLPKGEQNREEVMVGDVIIQTGY